MPVIPEPLLITGARGNLGAELAKVFPEAILAGRAEFDITDDASTLSFIKKTKPAAVIHLAAFTDVVKCEREKSLAWKTNVLGTENVANAIKKTAPSAYFVYLSTACVFRGDRGDYAERDVPDPVNFYGLTKLVGEFVAQWIEKFLIIRTNFVPRMPWKHEGAFSDRWGTYLFADDLARAIKDVMERDLTGVVHLCGDRKMSMFELAKIVSSDIKPITLDEYAAASEVHLTEDMTLRSERIKPYKITI